ncbi:MAG: flavin reductase [Candidatus Lokiarchaeota archaeon]
MLKEFPINIECKVIKRTKLGTHVIYLGEVMTVNVDEDILNNDVLDPSKQDQISYIAGNYYKISKNPFEKHGFSIK